MTLDVVHWIARLHADGFCVLPEAMPASIIARLQADLASHFDAAAFSEGGFYGARTKRFGGLLARSAHMASLVQHKLVLDIVEVVLGPRCDRYNLNLTQAIEIHPGALAQYPHRDDDMWPIAKQGVDFSLNVMWPLTPFTMANGATLLWPGSNRGDDIQDPVAAEMAPGSALVWLGSTRHGAGGNRSHDVRRGLIVGYCLGWLKPFENQWLVYPPEVARTFDADLAALVGYSQHRPNLGNVEGACPSLLLQQDPPKTVAARDALSIEQTEWLARYVAEQEAARAGLIGG